MTRHKAPSAAAVIQPATLAPKEELDMVSFLSSFVFGLFVLIADDVIRFAFFCPY